LNRRFKPFSSKAKSANVGPVVKQVQGTIEEICKTELDRYLKKAGAQEPKPMQELEAMITRNRG